MVVLVEVLMASVSLLCASSHAVASDVPSDGTSERLSAKCIASLPGAAEAQSRSCAVSSLACEPPVRVGPPASAAVQLGDDPPEPSVTRKICVRTAASGGGFGDASSPLEVCNAQPPGDVEAPSGTGAASGMAWELPVCVGPPASAAVPLGGVPPDAPSTSASASQSPVTMTRFDGEVDVRVSDGKGVAACSRENERRRTGMPCCRRLRGDVGASGAR